MHADSSDPSGCSAPPRKAPDEASDRCLGLIGIGLVGTALAERWLAAGWSVLGYDVVADRRWQLMQLGGTAGGGVGEVFDRCRRIVLSLPDSHVVTRVLSEVGSRLAAGTTVVDTTTGDPDEAPRRATLLAGRGCNYLDATIVGSSEQVRRGEAVVLVGGDRAVAAQCDALLRAFARHVLVLGGSGAGARMKLVVNLVLGLNRAVLAEGLMLGRACGFDFQQTLDALRATPAYSAIMDTKGPKMVAGDFTPQARLSQHLKDVRLILQLGNQAGQRLPLSEVHGALLEHAVQRGWGEADNSAILRAFESLLADEDSPHQKPDGEKDQNGHDAEQIVRKRRHDRIP